MMSEQTFELPPGLRLRGWQDADLATLQGWHNQRGSPLRLPQPGSAAAADPEAGEWLLLAETGSDQAQACLRWVPRLGLQMPRYSFHVGCVVHAASELGLFRAQSTLMLGNDHTGECELADLACAPQLRAEVQEVLLTALIRSALQKAAAADAPRGERLIVELAGPCEAGEGASPFWQGLGAHFYAGDPVAAQRRLGAAWRSHLAALLPRQTVYLSFLSEAAQAAAGQVGQAAQVAARALAAQGFAPSQHIAIDDGGPIWEQRLPPLAITKS